MPRQASDIVDMTLSVDAANMATNNKKSFGMPSDVPLTSHPSSSPLPDA